MQFFFPSLDVSQRLVQRVECSAVSLHHGSKSLHTTLSSSPGHSQEAG